jgi:hypothetical protein
MKVLIFREYGENETKGILFVLSELKIIYRCVTLELPDLDNQKNISCIPEGKYNVVKYWTPTLNDCFYIQEVSGRSEILIHVGKFAAGETINTKGCILVGNYFTDINQDGFMDIAEPRRTMDELYSILPSNFNLHII